MGQGREGRFLLPGEKSGGRAGMGEKRGWTLEMWA